MPIGAALSMTSNDSDDHAAAGLTLLGSLLLGPSLGHFYAGRPGRALIGIGLRTLALAGVTAGVAATWNGDSDAGAAAGYAGVALGGAVVLWDIVRAPHSAKVRNEQRRRSAAVTPVLSPEGSGIRFGARVSF
jgi:TM2 domain-containing membrane protein YozV